MFKAVVYAVLILVELSEYKVPELDISVTVTANGTIRLAAAVFIAPVIINLRARAARTCSYFPEIISFFEKNNSVGRNTDFLLSIF